MRQILIEVLGKEGSILISGEPAQNPIKERHKPQLRHCTTEVILIF
jgi:hypothetical protein